MSYRLGGIYTHKASGEAWFIPQTGKWVDEVPPIVVLQKVDDPTDGRAIPLKEFEEEFEDTDAVMPVEGTAKFD